MMDFRSGRFVVMASALRLKATAHPGLLMAVVQTVAVVLLLVSQLSDPARSGLRMQLGSDFVKSVLRAQR